MKRGSLVTACSGGRVPGMAKRPGRRHASRRSSSVQAMAYTMATNRHITPKPGQGWRVWAEWWTLVSWLPAWVGQNSVTGFRHESGSARAIAGRTSRTAIRQAMAAAEHDGHGQRPESRPDRTELGPLRVQHVGEGGCAEGRPVAGAGAGDRGADHPVAPVAWYSTLSRVSSMNASSSESRTGLRPTRTMPWAAAGGPAAALSIPVVAMTSGPVPAPVPATGAAVTGEVLPARSVAPASRQRAASSAAWGLRTWTDCRELDRTNSSTLVS